MTTPSNGTPADPTVAALAEALKILADESRLRILLALVNAQELHVTQICALLQKSQPAISHHLKMLRASHFVQARRDGKHNYYSFDCQRSELLLEYLLTMLGEDNGRVALGKFVLSRRRK